MEINDSEKQKILSDILNSHDFKDSKRYQDLLKYLVEKSEKGEPLKEIEIAIDVFGKDSSFDPNTNPLIRSYVSNLRKKLEHYYLTTEDKYSHKLEIPKGQYLVNFIPASNVNGYKNYKSKSTYIYLAVIVLLILFIVFRSLKPPVITAKSINSPNPSNFVWKDFLQSKNQATTIVLGDYLFMTKKKNGTDRIFIRNTKINNEKIFQQYVNKYPDLYGKYEILNFTYLRPSASFGLLEILRVLGTSNKNITIRLASQLKWNDLEKHNVIFLGTFKTLYRLDTLVSKTNLRFGVEPSFLKIINAKEDTVKSFYVHWTASNYQSDYSVLLKMPASEGNSILFCLGFSEIGVMDAVNSAISPNFLSRIEKYLKTTIQSPPQFFEMISECEGIELTPFRSNIRYFTSWPINKNN